MGWQWRKGWLHHVESRFSQTWVQKGHKCLLISSSWLQPCECPTEYNSSLLWPILHCHCSIQFFLSLFLLLCEQIKLSEFGTISPEEASLSVNVEGSTSVQTGEAITNGYLLFLRHLLRSLFWLRSPLHHAGRLPALITAQCCQHLPSQVVMTSAEGPFSFNKKQSLFLQSCLPRVIQQQLPKSLSLF